MSPYRHTFKVRVHSELSDYTAGIKKGGTFDITVAASEAEAAVVVVVGRAGTGSALAKGDYTPHGWPNQDETPAPSDTIGGRNRTCVGGIFSRMQVVY